MVPAPWPEAAIQFQILSVVPCVLLKILSFKCVAFHQMQERKLTVQDEGKQFNEICLFLCFKEKEFLFWSQSVWKLCRMKKVFTAFILMLSSCSEMYIGACEKQLQPDDVAAWQQMMSPKRKFNRVSFRLMCREHPEIVL